MPSFWSWVSSEPEQLSSTSTAFSMGRLMPPLIAFLQLRTAMGAFFAIFRPASTTFSHQFSLRIHSVDQTNAVSLVCLDVQCRVDQLLCHTHADQTCQTLGAAEARGDAQTHFGLTEHSVVRTDADVGAHSQLIAAAQCKAVSKQ